MALNIVRRRHDSAWSRESTRRYSFAAWDLALLNKNIHQFIALHIFMALLVCLPGFVSAATVSAQTAVAAGDADQDGVGSDTKLDSSPFKKMP